MKTQRIGFCGASGTGKSTLARAISTQFALEMNPIGSRHVATQMGFRTPYEVDTANLEAYQEALNKGFTTQQAADIAFIRGVQTRESSVRPLFQQRLQTEKLAWEADHQRFVVDRTPVDDLVYSLIHCPHAVDEKFIEAARVGLSRYDVVFYTPMDAWFDTAGDPSRAQDPQYHRRFQLIASSILCSWRSNVAIVSMPSLSRRIEFVTETVNFAAL